MSGESVPTGGVLPDSARRHLDREAAAPSSSSALGVPEALELALPAPRPGRTGVDTDSDYIVEEHVSGPVSKETLVSVLKDRAPTDDLDSQSMELLDRLSRYNLETAKLVGTCLANGSLRYEDLLSAYQVRGVKFAEGDSDDEDLCDEMSYGKAEWFIRHSYFYVPQNKPDILGRWREIHMPVIDTQYGHSGQLLLEWIPAYRRHDGRSTQPSFSPPEGSTVSASGQLTSINASQELRCTRKAPNEDLFGSREQQESMRLECLRELGRKIKESTNIPTMNKVDWLDPIERRNCLHWLSHVVKGFCEEFFIQGRCGAVKYQHPPTRRQVSDMMDGVYNLIMQGRALPTCESGRSKPSKCACCDESLFGEDEMGNRTIPPSKRRPENGAPWCETWVPPELCPICEHWVHGAEETTSLNGYSMCMRGHLMQHMHQCLAQGIAIRARWPHTNLLERGRKEAEEKANAPCPDLCRGSMLSGCWMECPQGRIHYQQDMRMNFLATNHGVTSVEDAEFNPARAISEEQPLSHRTASQWYDPMKTGSHLLGYPGEVLDLPAFPQEEEDRLKEPTASFGECNRVCRDSVRPRARQTKWEFEENDEPRDRIAGHGDSSEEGLDAQQDSGLPNNRCRKCGSWNCNLAPNLCARQRKYMLFNFVWGQLIDEDELRENLEREDNTVDEDDGLDAADPDGGTWCNYWRIGYQESTAPPHGHPTRLQYLKRAIEYELAQRESHVTTREGEKQQLREYRALRADAPSEEEIDTAIARINNSRRVGSSHSRVLDVWSKVWLPEQKPRELEDDEIVDTVVRAAQSAYHRGRISTGDILSHQDTVLQIRSLVESALKSTKEERRDIRFHITEILTRISGRVLVEMPWLFKLLHVSYWKYKRDFLNEDITSFTQLEASSDEQDCLNGRSGPIMPQLELCADMVKDSILGDFQFRIRKTRSKCGRERSRLTIFYLKDGASQRIKINTDQARSKLESLIMAGIRRQEIAETLHSIMTGSLDGIEPLAMARRRVERWTAKAAVRSGRALSLEELKVAFEGWEFTHPRSPEEDAFIKEEHIKQQPGKRLQDLVGTDHHPFGSWVCARCERVNGPRVMTCSTLEAALCVPYEGAPTHKVYFRCLGEKQEQYSGRPRTRKPAQLDNQEHRAKRAKTLSKLKSASRERGAVSDAEARGASSQSEERGAEVLETQRLRAETRRLRKDSDKFKNDSRVTHVLTDPGKWPCPMCPPKHHQFHEDYHGDKCGYGTVSFTMNVWNNSGAKICYLCQRPRPTHCEVANESLRLPRNAHLWWDCPICSTQHYRVAGAAKNCPDCKAPRPANAILFMAPQFNEDAPTNRGRELGRKAKSRQKHQERLAQAESENARLRREAARRQARHPQITRAQVTDDWTADDDNDAWGNWRPSRERSGERRIVEDESVRDDYPWNRGSRGALAGQPAGHLAPLLIGTMLCSLATPADAAYAHETGMAAVGMMFVAYIYRFLEGTKDVAAAVAENVVVMSDSITTTGIQQIEIAMPQLRSIFVATVAITVVVFLWIISKELRKKYGETPEANLADRLQGLADVDSPPELADPAPRLRPAAGALPLEDTMPPMPWLTKRVMDGMGPRDRHMSALALQKRPRGVVLDHTRNRLMNGDFIWTVQSVSGTRRTYTVRMVPEGATSTAVVDSKEYLSCTCNGYREIVRWSTPLVTCSHCLAVAKTVASFYQMFPIEILSSDSLQPPLAVGITDLDASTRGKAYAKAAGLTHKPPLVAPTSQPFGSSSSHGVRSVKHRVVIRGDSEPKEEAPRPGATISSSAPGKALQQARDAFEEAMQKGSLQSDPFADVPLQNSSDQVIANIAADLNLPVGSDYGKVLGMLDAEPYHRFAARLIEAGEQLTLMTCYTYDSEVITAALVAAGTAGRTIPQVLVDQGHFAQGKTKAMPLRLQRVTQGGCRVFLCKPKGFLHAKFMLVDEVALIGSANWTANSTKAEELSCVIKTTPSGRLALLKKFATWRSYSMEITSDNFERAAVARDSNKPSPPVIELSPVRERAKSEPRNTGSPVKEIDVTMQCLQEFQDGKSTNYILRDRKARKQKEALEVAQSMQQPPSLTPQQAQEELELQAQRVERMQQAIETMSV